jgi:hypothetical protein
VVVQYYQEYYKNRYQECRERERDSLLSQHSVNGRPSDMHLGYQN